MTRDDDDDRPGLGRRDLIASGLLAGAALSAVPAGPARAGSPAAGAAGSPSLVSPQLSPITTTIASPIISGYTYEHRYFFDFTPEASNAVRAFGGFGCYATAGTMLWASVEIPIGALVREIEWYIYNNSGGTIYAFGRLWGAGVDHLSSVVGDVGVAHAPGAIRTTRAVPTSSSWGPYPTGTRLALAFPSYNGANSQVNGVRVAFGNASAGTFTPPTMTLGYDTTVTGGKLAANVTRLLTIPGGSVAPAGTTGVVLLVTLSAGATGGAFKIWRNGAPEPATPQIYFSSVTTAAELTIPLTSTRQVNIKATRAVHARIDVVGRIA